MALGDKFKDLAKQAQVAVAERKEQITGAVERATVVADQRTGGKYSDKLAKVGQKAEKAVEKLSGDQAGAGEPGTHGPGTAAPDAHAPGAAAPGAHAPGAAAPEAHAPETKPPIPGPDAPPPSFA